jgi:hypothetical protein
MEFSAAADLRYTWEEGILRLCPAVVGKGGFMKETRLIMPELGLIAGTRAALGGGVALLLADKLTKEQRKAVGWTLFLVGAITTIPLVILALARRR